MAELCRTCYSVEDSVQSRQRPQKFSSICSYYLLGICKYGAHCKFRHCDTSKFDDSNNNYECGICYEKVTTSFGLLNCKCIFCVKCIRSWRSKGREYQDKETVRLCPLCRIETLIVLPSKVYISDTESKKKLFQAYKKNCSKISCKV